jgi:glycine oxidase
MSGSEKVVILGGGAAGCAAAYYLARAGLKSTIVEREGIGSQASGFSAGGINPLQGIAEPLQPLAMESYRLHLELWGELERLTGRSCQARIVTVVMVAFDRAEMSELLEVGRVFEATEGFAARWLERAELAALEPRIAPEVIGGLSLHGNGALDSQLYTELLAEAARGSGATVRIGAVRGLEQAGGRVTGVVLEDGRIPCDTVVVALGPWSGAAERWLGLPLPVEPLKGEILRMELPGPPLAVDLHGAEVSLYRRTGDQVWCASTVESRGFDRQPSESAYRFLLSGASKLVPAMAEAKLVRQTACLRPLTPDGVPILGKAPGWEGVYLATGGAKKGILLSTGMGRAIADLITEGGTSLPIAACAPERFAGVSA